MITVTKKDKEKTTYTINQNKIISIENGPGGKASIKMDDGSILNINETQQDIISKCREYTNQILRNSFKEALLEVKNIDTK